MSDAVQAYNDLVGQAVAKGLTKYKPVKRFSTVAAGEKRIADLRAILEMETALPPKQEEEKTKSVKTSSEHSLKLSEIKKTAKKATRKREATAKKVAKKAKKKTAKKSAAKKTSGGESDNEVTSLGVRPNSMKGKLLTHLLANKRKAIDQMALVSICYGNKSKEAVNSFSIRMADLIKTLKESRKYEIVRERNNEEVTFELKPKG